MVVSLRKFHCLHMRRLYRLIHMHLKKTRSEFGDDIESFIHLLFGFEQYQMPIEESNSCSLEITASHSFAMLIDLFE